MNGIRRESKPITVEGITLNDDFVWHPQLGQFRRTGERRIPLYGEHYLGDLSVGICLAGTEIRTPHEILEEVK